MNCAEWQEKVALFAGADLPADEALSVEAHLSVCEECRGFERELSDTRAMLLSMRTIDEAEVATVRSNVLRELLERPRRSAFAWMPYATAAAAAVVLVFGLTMLRKPVTPRAPAAASVLIPAEPHASTSGRATTTRVASRKPRLKAQRKPAAEPPPEPTVVTLFTDDPDVVIVWIAD